MSCRPWHFVVMLQSWRGIVSTAVIAATCMCSCVLSVDAKMPTAAQKPQYRAHAKPWGKLLNQKTPNQKTPIKRRQIKRRPSRRRPSRRGSNRGGSNRGGSNRRGSNRRGSNRRGSNRRALNRNRRGNPDGRTHPPAKALREEHVPHHRDLLHVAPVILWGEHLVLNPLTGQYELLGPGAWVRAVDGSWYYNASAVLAEIHQEMVDLDKAIADFTSTLEHDPKNATALQGRARAYYGKGDFENGACRCR